ncbi:MAG TPA: hypothetical protein VN976_20045 [Verrucomicrobiae bacterium]|nr:hypothetical protein [Verrucomicrobiae bacterium]
MYFLLRFLSAAILYLENRFYWESLFSNSHWLPGALLRRRWHRIARITSAAYQLALAECRTDELDNVARPNLSGESKIAAFMARVEVVPDKELEQHYPERWPARAEAQLKNGRTKTSLVLDARGDPPRSCDLDVRAKFHRLADPVIGKPAANKLADACLASTEHDDALTILCDKFNS